jgi:hypothetical protein
MEETIKIYTLSDKTGIRYVGQSKTPNKRYYRHIFDAKQDGFKNKRCAWVRSLLNKNETPIMEIIDEVSTTEWAFWEQYWISQIKSWGFNLTNDTNGGDGTYGRIVTEQTKQKMSESKKGKTPKNLNLLIKSRVKPILQYNLNGEFIKEWESVNLAKDELNINNIELVVNGKRNSAGGYIWRYSDNELIDNDINEIFNKHIKQQPKIILQINKNGEIIKEWFGVNNASKTYGGIPAVLRGDRKTAGGYS